MKSPLHLFYEEPDPDRWVKYDRYPRRVIRQIFRGEPPVGGVKKWFVNLVKGLDALNQPYTINKYNLLKRQPDDLALVIGKPQVLQKIPANLRVMYGPAIASHPSDPDFAPLLNKIEHLIVPCEWTRELYARDLPFYLPISTWAAGIETDEWKPPAQKKATNTVLLYDKVRWDREHYTDTLINPIMQKLQSIGIKVEYLKYGEYQEENYKEILQRVDAMVFLCEHETQGFAYLQALSSNVPILAWDVGGYWKDPSYYPNIQFGPVTSVPYWDERCGKKFKDFAEFEEQLMSFYSELPAFEARNYILENLTLKMCAQNYIDLYTRVKAGIN